VSQTQRPRIIEIIRNLTERITEARMNGWLGEVKDSRPASKPPKASSPASTATWNAYIPTKATEPQTSAYRSSPAHDEILARKFVVRKMELRHKVEIHQMTGRVVECPIDEMNRPRGRRVARFRSHPRPSRWGSCSLGGVVSWRRAASSGPPRVITPRPG
jgi:hypothetical protein